MNTELQAANAESRRRNLLLRLLTGVPALVAVLVLALLAPWPVLTVLVALAAASALFEYRSLMASGPGIALPLTPLLGGAGLIIAGGTLWGAEGMHAMLLLAAMAWILACGYWGEAGHLMTLHRIWAGLFGLIWIGWFFGHWALVLRLPQGAQWSVFLLVVVTANDTLAYLAGSMLGRHPLLPRISPKKTVEGSLGGVAGGMLGGMVAAYWLPGMDLAVPLTHVLALGVAGALLGQAGDLLESLVKRLAGVKDSGCFLPGHGGFLDRMDSLLLTPPLLYYYLTLVRG